MYKHFCIALIILLLASPVHNEASTKEWAEQPFFIKAMGQYYFQPYSPEFVAPGFLGAGPGFRAALGYEWRCFDFSLESGISYLEGQDPYRIYVEDITIFPLLFKFGYTFPLPAGFGIQPEAGAGAVFYNTTQGNMEESLTANMMAGARLNLVWEIPKAPSLRLHIGGGADMIPETDALILIPAVEAGITFKPRLPRRVTPSLPPEVTQEALKNVEEIDIDEVIHFVPDSDEFLPDEYPWLDVIAAALKLFPANRSFLVDGHVADVPSSPVDAMDLSDRRARRMIEALIQRGIGRERFVYQAWGSTKPVGDNDTEEGRRLNRRTEITVLKESTDPSLPEVTQVALKNVEETAVDEVVQFVPDSDQFLPDEDPRLDVVAGLSGRRDRRMIGTLSGGTSGGSVSVYRARDGTKPVGDSDTEESRRLDRRAEIIILEERRYL